MIKNLCNMTDEEIKRDAKEAVSQIENGQIETDESDYYLDKVYETLETLNEKENDLTIKQNDRERINEAGANCFETALKGSKTYLKSRKN